MRLAEYVAHKEDRNGHRILVGNPEKKKQIERPRGDIILTLIFQKQSEDVDWIQLA
jgi:hypothetical protein